MEKSLIEFGQHALQLKNTEYGIKTRKGGVYCQGPVTPTTATARHLNRIPMHGVLVAGHLKMVLQEK